MLIEWNKLSFRQRDNNLSHVYAMFSVDWDRETDRPTGRVSYEGVASLEKLRADCKTTKVLRKGDTLPGTKTRLQADNYGIHFRDLYKHLNHFVDYLQSNKPPASLTDDFPNPYTGQTTKEMLVKTVAATKTELAKEPEVSFFASIKARIVAIFTQK